MVNFVRYLGNFMEIFAPREENKLLNCLSALVNCASTLPSDLKSLSFAVLSHYAIQCVYCIKKDLIKYKKNWP